MVVSRGLEEKQSRQGRILSDAGEHKKECEEKSITHIFPDSHIKDIEGAQRSHEFYHSGRIINNFIMIFYNKFIYFCVVLIMVKSVPSGRKVLQFLSKIL